mmetsp:Transcript_134377/g.374535  ORF Transcript_134377/g.374535 Transcript_134377/m.374535 type:complete len:263 (-) Transcript_134377:1130-1918(-)
MACCILLWRSMSRGYLAMIMKKSSRFSTAKSDSFRATMVAVRMRCSSKRHASPNQAPVSMLQLWCTTLLESSEDSWPERPLGPTSSSGMSKYRPSDLLPNRAVSWPWTTKTTSRVSCPSSATMSPCEHCTQTWACASSPTKDRFTPLKSGNSSTTSRSSARASSRCTVGVSSRKRSESMDAWPLLCRRLRRMCCTRFWSSGAMPRRRMKRCARATRRSSGSSKRVPMACEVTETIVPKKTDAMSIAKMANSLEKVPVGTMSP